MDKIYSPVDITKQIKGNSSFVFYE